MSSKSKIIKIVLVVIGTVFILLFMIVSIFSFIKERTNNEGKTIKEKQYDFTKEYKDLKLGSINNYVDYLNELLKELSPKELKNLVGDNKERALRYENQAYQEQTGKEILLVFKGEGYRETLKRVTTPNSDWEGLPLTDSFRSKYNENDSAIDKSKFLQHPGDYAMSLSGFNLGGKKFAMIYSQLEKAEWGGDYEQEYLDWYDFILDDGGYLDDILFNHTERIEYESYYDEAALSEIDCLR